MGRWRKYESVERDVRGCCYPTSHSVEWGTQRRKVLGGVWVEFVV